MFRKGPVLLAAGLLGLVVLPSPGSGQTTARQATPEEVAKAERGPQAEALEEVPNPMLLEVKLKSGPGRPAFASLKKHDVWSTAETAQFVCDRARIQRLAVEMNKVKDSGVEMIVYPIISSGWYRQDIDLTVEVLSATGRRLARRFWNDLTIGNAAGPYAGHTKSPKLLLVLHRDAFEREFTEDNPPTVRVLMEIQGQKGDEDDD